MIDATGTDDGPNFGSDAFALEAGIWRQRDRLESMSMEKSGRSRNDTEEGVPSATPRTARSKPKKIRKRDAEATRAQILSAAIEEFSEKGLPHARIEDIAHRAGANRRMIYYYYDSKEALYIAALETVYFELIEEEGRIDVENLEPLEAIAELVRLKIEHYQKFPHFIRFVNMENLYHARYIGQSGRLRNTSSPEVKVLARVLEKGVELGILRENIDPVDLYISISALGFMYFSNQYTLGLIFERDLTSPAEVEKKKNTMVQMISRFVLREV